MTPDSTRLPFEMEIEIRSTDIDQLDHVNNVVYLRWVQDAAVAHWSLVATVEEQKKYVWVVRRHEIDYKRAALAGDTIVVRTWIGAAAFRSFDRHTEILRKSDKKLLAKARTVWSPLDAETKRPTDVTPEVYARFSTNDVETDKGGLSS